MPRHYMRHATLFYLSIKDDGPSPVKGSFRLLVSLSGVDDNDDDASMRGPSINEVLPVPLPLSPINAYPVPVLPFLCPLPRTASKSLMTPLATRLASASSINA